MHTHLHVSYLGLVRNVIGRREETLDVLASATVGQLLGLLADNHDPPFKQSVFKQSGELRASNGGVDNLRSGKVDVVASSVSRAQRSAADIPEAKVVPGAFTSDRYMVALPKGRSFAAQSKLVEIVKEAKKAFVVRKTIEQLGMKSVRAAPD